MELFVSSLYCRKSIEIMMRPFIIDKEILLSEENDLLKTRIYANTLIKLINNTPPDKVFTIGLFGNWGTGKSSIIETAKQELETDNPKIKFITYDAWKYSNDSFRRMFLLKLREELHFEETDLMKKFYANETTDIGRKYQLSSTRLVQILIGLVFLILIIYFLPIKLDYKVSISGIFTLLGLLITVISGAFYQLKISVTKSHLFAPEQFEECFKEIVSNSLSPSNKALKWIKGNRSIQGLEKLIIVIDNIDRCHEAMAYQLLTDIKTFLSNEEYNVVFIVPVDDEALKKHLFEISKSEKCNKEKEEFLRKFFNVSLRIKPHQPTEMQAFTHNINNKYNLGFSSDTLALAAKEYATNPRRIIQLLNNLSSELNMYPDDFATRNETIICAIIILKEEFFDFYKKAIEDVRLLIDKYEDVLQGNDETNKLALVFMRSANVYFRNTKLDDILTVLTNTNEQFTSIPNSIKEDVRKFNIDAILKFAGDGNCQFNKLVSYIVASIKTDVQYGAVSQLTNWLDFIARFISVYSFDKPTLAILDSKMKTKYNEMIPLSRNAIEICQYANKLSEFKLSSLKNTVISHINLDNKESEKPVNKDSYITAVLSTFNNEADSKVLVSFADKYFQDNWIDKSINYTEAQKKFLFSDTQITNLIKTFDSLTDEDLNKELIWLFTNKPNISQATYGEFFSHVSSMLGEMRNKAKDDILNVINFLMPYLSLIKSGALKTEPLELYTKLFAERGIANPSYPSHTHSDTKVNLLSECIDDDENSNMIAIFCTEIYRITANAIQTKEQFDVLFTKHKLYVNSLFVKLLGFGFNLAPLFCIILTDDDYSDSNNLILTKNCFVQRKKDGSLYLTERQIIQKITSLIDNVANQNVVSLILDIIASDDLKAVVVENLTNRDSEYINSLPSQLLTLAIGAFDKNTSRNYSDNYTYLGVIAEKGSKSQRSELVRILNSNFSDNKDIEATLSVFEKMGSIGSKATENLLIAQLEQYIESYTNEDVTLKNRAESLLNKYKPTIQKRRTKK